MSTVKSTIFDKILKTVKKGRMVNLCADANITRVHKTLFETFTTRGNRDARKLPLETLAKLGEDYWSNDKRKILILELKKKNAANRNLYIICKNQRIEKKERITNDR